MGRLEGEIPRKETFEVQEGEQSKIGRKTIKTIEKLGKKSDKKTDLVLVQYLTIKQQVKFMVSKVISGNLIVVENKVHKLNPKKVWRYKKTIWYIVREIDREPVSNMDYDKVVERKDDTDSDVPLIKAVLGAVQKQQTQEAKTIWIIIGIIALIGIVAFFMFYKSKGGA